jgi:hypothetical protein
MTEKSYNGDNGWLTWTVRLVLPALIAALWAVQWASLSAQIDDLRDEVKEMRGDIRGELVAKTTTNAEQDARLARLETQVGLLREDGRGD